MGTNHYRRLKATDSKKLTQFRQHNSDKTYCHPAIKIVRSKFLSDKEAFSMNLRSISSTPLMPCGAVSIRSIQRPASKDLKAFKPKIFAKPFYTQRSFATDMPPFRWRNEANSRLRNDHSGSVSACI